MRTLVIADHNQNQISQATYNTISAAQKIGFPIDIIILGKTLEKPVEEARKINGINTVLVHDNDIHSHFIAENIANTISEIANSYTHILAPATSFGKNVTPRLAGLLNLSMISEVIDIETPEIFIRPIYAGNALCKIQSLDPIKILTVRASNFAKASCGQQIATLQHLNSKSLPFTKTTFLNQEKTHSKRPELTNAKIVVSGGRGLQSKDNFKLIEELADCLNAAIGASRAAVDAGFISNDFQVGQTGKVVAPDLYFAIGISGAIQHISGMKDSKTIIAINKDPDAPIFKIADYGLVGDLFDFIPQLLELLRR